MRNQLAGILRSIADRLDPQPPVPEPGSFQVHTATGTMTYEPRLVWLGRIEDTC